MNLLENLNPPQREAVLHTQGPLLIFAGAGSGKTRVLVHRIANLIQNHGVSPWNIFAVTFTNKAAGEMRERIGRLLGSRADDVWISTFHSAGVRILRKHAEQAGLGPFFTIFDDADQLSLIKEALEALNLNIKLFHPKAMAARINQAKNELVTAEEYALAAKDFFEEKTALVYSWYQEALTKNNAVDFGDLLLLPVHLFEKNQEILRLYQNRLRYLLVDEYQDTNHAQYRLIKLLSEAHQNLCVVGDDDQSIYRWRGANLRNILDFELDFPSATVIKLEQNYRSTQTIIKAAGEVVKKIEDRKPKELWTENEEGEPIVYFTASNEKGEASFVVREVQRWVENEGSLNDCALFYRTNAQSRILEDELRRCKIPYIIIGGTRFYDRMEIKDILAYLYTIANSADSLHLKRIINVPARGIGKTSIERLETFAGQRNITLWEALSLSDQAGVGPKIVREVKKFVHLIEILKVALSPSPQSFDGLRTGSSPVEGEGAGIEEGMKKHKLSDWVRSLIEQTGYLAELKLQKTLEAEERIENLEELINVVVDYEAQTSEPTLAGFLDQITLASDVDQLSDDRGILPLMTLHLAKGLEFDQVFIVGLEEGLFPHTRSLDTPEEMDEERRLMYVGMTRAKKRLYLTNAIRRSVYGSEQYNLSSRFLEDIPFEFIDRQEEVRRSFESTGDVTSAERADFDENNPYQIGRRVKHPLFGMGTIKSCEGSTNDRKLTILFQNGELKRLVAKYSNLQLM
jgi:DNA helicase-2/ATP-dependent DNA helicase PcrA